MNVATRKYWQDFWQGDPPQNVQAWQFGASPNELAQLVIDGTKSATCSAHCLYEIENEPLPKVGDYSIILNETDQPLAIIQTSEVNIMPLNEVSEDFAYAEGEGDRSYQYWWEAHVAFFTEDLKSYQLKFSEEMLVVCERFKLVDVKQN